MPTPDPQNVGTVRRNPGAFVPGPDPRRGTTGGRPKSLKEIEQMLDAEHRTVENMRAVFARLKALALGQVVTVTDKDGTVDISLQADPAYMKLYLDRVLGPVKELITDEDLRDAPDVVVEWLRRAS